MADLDAPPMHEDFARWYSVVSLGDDPPGRQARWQGVSSVVSNANRDTVEDLLRLAHGGLTAPKTAAVQELRKVFKASDDTFPMSGNLQELRVLAGACLVVMMELDEDPGPAAALSCTTSGLGDARRPDLPMDLEALGEAAIIRCSEARRKRPSLATHFAAQPPPLDFSQAAAKAKEQDWEAQVGPFELAANATRSALKQFARIQEEAIRAVDDFLRVQDEELDMLWWLTGQRSSDYRGAFSTIPPDARPLVLAKELADMTACLPGPPSICGILSRAGLKERKKIPITVAVNAAKAERLQRTIGELIPSPVSTPLHEAIKRQLETGKGQAWVPGWAGVTGLDAAYALSGLALGNLFYRERLLLTNGLVIDG